MGRVYYSFTVCTTPFVCFYFGSRYLSNVDESSRVFSSEQVYGAIGILTVIQILTFVVLLKLSPKYRNAFLSFKTGSESCIECFNNASEDDTKIFVFGDYEPYWTPIEADVKKWLNERLGLWIDEEPKWFDSSVKAMIPVKIA